MNPIKEFTRLIMVRESLDGIAHYDLPHGYAVRWYQPGDEKIWQHIQSLADRHNKITPELFAREFGSDAALLVQRQSYLLDSRGDAVGTATAWFSKEFEDGSYGRVHWVAILPEHQGRGLSNPLMTIVCQRLKELGHSWAYLTTSSARLPAINLYLKFGFVPLIRSAEEARVWRDLKPLLKRPQPP